MSNSTRHFSTIFDRFRPHLTVYFLVVGTRESRHSYFLFQSFGVNRLSRSRRQSYYKPVLMPFCPNSYQNCPITVLIYYIITRTVSLIVQIRSIIVQSFLKYYKRKAIRIQLHRTGAIYFAKDYATYHSLWTQCTQLNLCSAGYFLFF